MPTRRFVGPLLLAALLVATNGHHDSAAASSAVLALSGLKTDKSALVVGDSLKIQVSLSDVGKQTAHSSSVNFLIVPSGQSLDAGSTLTTLWVGTVRRHSTITLVTTVPIGAPPGAYSIAAIAKSKSRWSDPVYTSLTVQSATDSTWAYCAEEYQTCTFSGTRTVRYGIDGNYVYGTYTGGVACSNGVFGDPAVGAWKHCDTLQTTATAALTPSQSPSNDGTWTYCADEYQTCGFAGTRTVRYGVDGSYAFGTFTDGVACNNGIFGDPAFGALKHCDVQNPTTTPLVTASSSAVSTPSTGSTSASTPSTSTTTSSTTLTNSTPCDYYAAPNAGGDGRTPSTPFTIQSFWSVAAPGKTLCLLDGVYQGAANLIQPPPGLSGNSSARITIQAYHDGGALLDGQFTNIPVLLRANSWWLLQGFNAKNGGPVVIYLGYGMSPSSDNNILRRIVAWDADGTRNTAIAEHYNANNNLWEDIALFGLGPRTWEVYIGANNTCRRCWVRFEGSLTIDPQEGFDPAYGAPPGSIQASATICDNCLGTWWAGSMPTTYQETDGSGVGDGVNRTNQLPANTTGPFFSQANPGECGNVQVYGSLFYLRSGDSIASGTNPTQMFGIKYSDCNTVKDLFVMVPSGFSGASSIGGLTLGVGNAGATKFNVLDHATVVNHTSNDIDSSWTVTNSTGTLGVTSVPTGSSNPWTGTNGANLCFQYVNGTKTTTPLWPWPMDARIAQALNQAGSYQGPCNSCSGGRLTRAATLVSVTSDVETLLGTIPAQCRR